MGMNLPKDATTLNTVEVTLPYDLVTDSAGNIYVLSAPVSSQSQVLIYNPLLVQQGAPINVDATDARGIALDSSGRIYIADTYGNRILRYKNNSGWALDEEFGGDGIVGEAGTGDGQFDQPCGIAIDWSGFVYVTDRNNDRVQVFNSSGAFVRKFGQSGNGDGQLDGPRGLYLLGSSRLFITEHDNHRAQILSPFGYFFGKVGGLGSGAGQFITPGDVCYDLNYDQMIVADTGNNRLQIFQLYSYGGGEPTFVMEIADQGLASPMGVACASTDTQQILYIADTGGSRVIRLEIQQNLPARTPLHIWELTKAALWNNDKNRAVGFFDDISKDQYSQIFNLIESHLQEYVSGMGNMTLAHQTSTEVKYEMSHWNGTSTYSFPVFFTKDENGDWRLLKF